MGLFSQGNFTLHSKGKSWFKISCAFLSDDDWRTIARLIADKIAFRDVVGIPTGGLRLAEALRFYCNKIDGGLPILIVDDVLTTGASMVQMRIKIGGYCVGIVLFARGNCPWWVIPVFDMNKNFEVLRGKYNG